MSGIGSLYSRLGEYLDIYLQPLAAKGRSYLKGSRELINRLQNIELSADTLLVTVDIESLYTNIKKQDAIVAVKLALTEESKLKKPQINFLVEGQNQFYNQIKGVAMGARYTPSGTLMTSFFCGRGHRRNWRPFYYVLNNNKYGLKFTAEWNLETIKYLDLTLVKNRNKIGTKTFFKIEKALCQSIAATTHNGWERSLKANI